MTQSPTRRPPIVLRGSVSRVAALSSPSVPGWMAVQSTAAGTVLAVVGWLGVVLGLGWGLVVLVLPGLVAVACATSLVWFMTRRLARTALLAVGVPVLVLAVLARL
ncbi:hypothetical protein [Nocardioides rubriscoriae]|uniref:hypothetical protein n=1 Tax=Nocardioides rubriscoriae TaxID=642762 RepID=UPI0011DFED74|nr:hypothetical protein [Nocardioides rubriscoriae]